jgi:hypothetical protein
LVGAYPWCIVAGGDKALGEKIRVEEMGRVEKKVLLNTSVDRTPANRNR